MRRGWEEKEGVQLLLLILFICSLFVGLPSSLTPQLFFLTALFF